MTRNDAETWGRADLAIALALALLAFALYANTLGGDFVYDDAQQIVANPLIREGRLFWRAMTSDVWAFRADASEPRSSYWRPAFVLWLILNERLFGLESAAGWHALNIALHALVCVIGYRLIRRLGGSRTVAAAIMVVFCAHPVQVESVAWISGSPNILSAATLLGALSFFLAACARPSGGRWAGALGLYSLSLLSKEVAVLFPLIAFAVALSVPPQDAAPPRERLARAARRTAPFLAIAAAFLVLRFLVLGRIEIRTPWHRTPLGLLASVPSLLAFYLRQIVFPVPIGPSYPLRAIEPGDLGLSNFVLPLAVVLFVFALVLRRASRDSSARIGAMLFLLPLLPAMNINAYIPEQIVHDRYLYLPLLGALLLLLPAAASRLERRLRLPAVRAERLVAGAALVLSIPLALQTLAYSRAWRTELALWERAVQVDPQSAFNLSQYGIALRRAGRIEEAKAVLDRAIAIHPNTFAFTERAIIAMGEGRLADAERDLRAVISQAGRYTSVTTYEQLCSCLARQSRFEEAAALLREARERKPSARCRFTANLAVILHQIGDQRAVLAELESVRTLAREDPDPAGRRVLFLLGMAYTEAGRGAEARGAFEEYLALTRADRDAETLALRKSARAALGSPGG